MHLGTSSSPGAARGTSRVVLVLLLAALLASLTAAARAAAPPPPREPTARAYAEVTRRLDDLGVPGWAVAVVSKDRVLHQQTSGSTSSDAPVTSWTPFLIGSVSKTMTATAVMRLVDQGAIDLARPATTYLPDLTLAGGQGRDITVRQLLTHTSGIGSRDGLSRGDVVDDRPDALQRLTRTLKDAEPVAGAGERYEYSSANYLVLGAIVEKVTGKPFAAALDAQVLQPLGMASTITTPARARAAGLEAGHRYVFGRATSLDRPYATSAVPFEYVGSTLSDLTRYARFQLDPSPDVLSRGSAEAMQRPQVSTGESERFSGMGWSLGRLPGVTGTVVEHTGATPGSFAHVLLHPSKDIAVVVLANAASEAKAPALAGVGEDLVRTAEGVPPQPAGSDPLLGAAPWIGLAIAVVALLVLAVQGWRLARGRRTRVLSRVLLTVLCVLLVAAVVLLPGMVLGVGWSELRLWAPDLAWSLTAAGVLWACAAVAALVRLRHRAPPRAA